MSTQKLKCNALYNDQQVYLPNPLELVGYAAQKSTAWSSLVSSSCMSVILAIPLGLAYSKNGFQDSATIVMAVILLCIISSMSSTYSKIPSTPDGYTTDCIKDENLFKKA